MLVIIGISLFLLILSLFLRDPIKDLREEIDQLSIQQVQELYKIKKKLKLLEEELMIGEEDFSLKPSSTLKNHPQWKGINHSPFTLLLKTKSGPLQQVVYQLSRLPVNLPYLSLKFSKL